MMLALDYDSHRGGWEGDWSGGKGQRRGHIPANACALDPDGDFTLFQALASLDLLELGLRFCDPELVGWVGVGANVGFGERLKGIGVGSHAGFLACGWGGSLGASRDRESCCGWGGLVVVLLGVNTAGAVTSCGSRVWKWGNC